ncbi:MAG: hypothetical protein ACJ74U_18035 [Jatrophihabitantaceae bacterium]
MSGTDQLTQTQPHPAAGGEPCGCDACLTGDLPVNPFLALRVAYGMLLGEDDFRTMMGNPRGKGMLHSAWLHGCGVVWGYGIEVDGVWNLRIGPGLAIDGLGRELLSETTTCWDVRPLVEANARAGDECGTRTVHACLVVEFDCCQSSPVPTLADPCDVTRRHDDYSRIVERVRFDLRAGDCPCPRRPYRRLRMLLGLDRCDDEEVREARDRVSAAPPRQRAEQLLREFRCLAAADCAELHPAREAGDCFPTLFPVPEDCAAVVLACIEVDVRDTDGCSEILEVRVDSCCRTTLLPTATIQELTCGLAAGLVSAPPEVVDVGPRVAPPVVWSEDGRRLLVPVTAALVPGSVRRAVEITSLSDRGWVDEDIESIRYEPDGPAIVVHLADRPINDVVRLIVRGTGPTPVYGADPVMPLSGVVGAPPSAGAEGRDAVLSFTNPIDRTDES